jgi:hypothetical protein
MSASNPPNHPSNATSSTSDADVTPFEVVRRCCIEAGLDPDRDADEVALAVDYPIDRDCCESGCEPCVLTINRAASLAKRRLRR